MNYWRTEINSVQLKLFYITAFYLKLEMFQENLIKTIYFVDKQHNILKLIEFVFCHSLVCMHLYCRVIIFLIFKIIKIPFIISKTIYIFKSKKSTKVSMSCLLYRSRLMFMFYLLYWVPIFYHVIF